MSDPLQIAIDGLKSGKVLKIDAAVDPAFLQIQEKELSFPAPVKVVGEAYLTDSDLILRLKAKTRVMLPCAICNQMIETEVKVDDMTHAEPIAELKSNVFDCRELLREDLLIELPQYVECKGGKCPERSSVTPYLRSQERVEKNTYFPFSDLDKFK